MHQLYQTLIAEWQDSHITYPEWLTHVVMDEVYYIATVILVCATSFAVGMIIGIVWTLV
jgi:hypothetical protein